MTYSESKTIHFTIEKDKLPKGMNGIKSVVGEADVSIYDSDDLAVPEYEIDLSFSAIREDGGHVPVGDFVDELTDTLFEHVNEKELLDMNEDEEYILGSEKVPNDKISRSRYIALKVALGHFLCEEVQPEEWEALQTEEDIEKYIDGIVWEPFERYDLTKVINMIEDLAYSVERNIKEY